MFQLVARKSKTEYCVLDVIKFSEAIGEGRIVKPEMYETVEEAYRQGYIACLVSEGAQPKLELAYWMNFKNDIMFVDFMNFKYSTNYAKMALSKANERLQKQDFSCDLPLPEEMER